MSAAIKGDLDTGVARALPHNPGIDAALQRKRCQGVSHSVHGDSWEFRVTGKHPFTYLSDDVAAQDAAIAAATHEPIVLPRRSQRQTALRLLGRSARDAAAAFSPVTMDRRLAFVLGTSPSSGFPCLPNVNVRGALTVGCSRRMSQSRGEASS